MRFQGRYKDAGGVLQSSKLFLGFMWPDMARLLRVDVLEPKATDFFCNIIKAQLAERQKTGKKRNDFIDSMLQVTRLET